MTPITVKASPGLKVPLEGAARRYITDADPATVPASPYYLRRIADGDLVRLPETAAKAKTKATTTEADNG